MTRAALTLLLASIASAEARGPSTIIIPEQRIPLRFSHRQHLALNVKCEFCHSKAALSRVARDFLVPPEEVCADCHAIERDKPNKQAKPVAACGGCHPGFSGIGQPARIEIPPPFVKFNHQVHVSRGVECVTCHATVPTADLATRAELPRMPLCLSCHDGKQAPSQCTTCHLGDAEGRIKTALPTGTLTPSGVLRGDAHDLRFKMDHRRVAANDERYCENCHRQEWCQSCHNGIVKPLDFHGNDYLSLHAADARRNIPDCASCHRRQTFCLGCHQRSGVALARDVRGVDPSADTTTNAHFTQGRKFHPEGWIDDARGPSHHAPQAQRNIAASASCHPQETCLASHATAGLRSTSPVGRFVDPHPAGFATSRRCRALADKNPRACLKCHTVDDPARSCR
ncbi:MAG: cytochrome c3 family protein [Myxococcota bacterium]